MEVFFWISLSIVFYTYVGYGMVLYGLVSIKRWFVRARQTPAAAVAELPSCSVVVAAYNEALIIEQKIINTLALTYPPEKIHFYVVTDGSADESPRLVANYPQVRLLHVQERLGKIAAIHRVMCQVTTDVVVFTDANTLLNQEALMEVCKHYADDKIGAVAGEKRVHADESADASSAGEGFYWKYESTLKKWDSELYSVVGSAGELFSIRSGLYEAVPPDTVLDDFMISMRIAEKGYRVVYEPNAYATEMASENVNEELKRKIRIAAGGIQSIVWLNRLLNPFIHPILTFQYVSHRVLRWTITPVLLVVVFVVNAALYSRGAGDVYTALFYGQLLFYSLAVLGLLLERKALKLKAAFIPYYFCVMNYAVLAGMIRYFKGTQSVTWEKANRKPINA
ncbi:glycosyltransferase family 2 protein [Parapedobacter sp. DT-150]|uniref:glycosyltransferase family 2 protein n=1 Tax=Parapedobacter sp. DT-150 TaxID=3396162 RepID=UPI003F1B18B5